MATFFRSLFAILLVCLSFSCAFAQERGLGGNPEAKDTPPPQGVDKYYWDLTKSQDRQIKSAAEGYVSMVRLQEWSDQSGKFKTIASYVKHAPDLSTVTIEIVKGRGAEQSKEQKTVPVDKLSPTCQSRVRRIDAAQKKLKALAAAKPGENGAAPGAAPPSENPGGPMRDDIGNAPAPGAQAAAPAGPEGGAPPSATPGAEPDPSASDPDPLGFAEIPAAPAAPPGGELAPTAGPETERR